MSTSSLDPIHEQENLVVTGQFICMDHELWVLIPFVPGPYPSSIISMKCFRL
jgi:hypothetical protein